MTILFVISSLLVARMLFRWRMRHLWAHGGCGRFRRFGFSGPVDLGAPDDDVRFGGMPWRGRRKWQRAARRWDRDQALVPVAAKPPRADVAAVLEMNQRQQELYDEVMERARNWVDTQNLAQALAAVAREPFERTEVERLVGSVEIADDFEHLHHSLTSEQRARLRAVTAA